MTMETLNRNSFFSYHCNACGRCCFNKRIQINPYEALRLARNLGISTGEFANLYLEREGPYLSVTADGACVFLNGNGCGVHADRPLACRTYPLGRWVSADAEETFRELKPHPQTEGGYGQDGTVGFFLAQQGALPFMDTADRYQALFYRLFDTLHLVLPTDPTLADETQIAMFACDEGGMPAFMKWLDVDDAVELYCKEHRMVVPPEIAGIVSLHIQSIDQWFNMQ